MSETPSRHTHQISEELRSYTSSLELTQAQEHKRMELMVEFLTRYMVTYPQQHHYRAYSDETLINDVLYGLGVALNVQGHSFADGYERWKQTLKSFLETNTLPDFTKPHP